MRSHTEPYWQMALKAGLIGGAVAVLFSLVGMVEAFGQRQVIGALLSMGHAFLVATMLYSGYLAARRAQPAGRTAALVAGVIAGAVVGACLAALVVIGQLVNLRAVLANASAGLYRVLTFGQPPFVGAGLLVVLGAVAGALAGSLILLSPAVRRTVLLALGVVVTVGVLADLLRIIVTPWGIYPAITWMFSGKGLSIPGAVVVAGVVAGVSWLRERGVFNVQRPVAGAAWRGREGLVRFGGILLVLALLPLIMGSYMSEVLDQVGLFILMGLGLNIVVGFAGLLDLGYVAFFAIGAYVTGILTSTQSGIGMSWWAALPMAVLVATLAGVLLGIPVLKMRGDYLAIVTLGFGEIIRVLALSDWLRPWLGGAQGILGIPKPAIGGFAFDDPVTLYYLILLGCLVAVFISIRLRDSRMGRAWMAMREDEDVAQAIGINLVATKLIAFATGAALSGLSGAIFAAKLTSIFPHSFALLISINVLALIIIGGMGSIPGVVVGALVLVGLPELLREFADFRLLVYGALLVAMMLYRPEGLWPEAAHKRELHAEEQAPAEDHMAEPVEPGEPSIEVGLPDKPVQPRGDIRA